MTTGEQDSTEQNGWQEGEEGEEERAREVTTVNSSGWAGWRARADVVGDVD